MRGISYISKNVPCEASPLVNGSPKVFSADSANRPDFIFLPISIRKGQRQETGEYKFFLGVINLLLIVRR